MLGRVAATFAMAVTFAIGDGIFLSGCRPVEGEETEPPEPPEPPEPVEPVRNVGPITDITPKAATAGQKLTVSIKIGGEPPGTEAEVHFGAGIDVIKATQVPGGLDVEISVDAEATPGPRDVTVLPDDAKLLTATAGFSVASALDVTVAAGAAEQGGLVRLNVASKDGVALNATSFVLEPVVNPGVPSLSQHSRGTFTATNGSVVMLGDPLALPGPLDLIGINDPLDVKSSTFFAKAPITVASRTPVVLATGVPSNVTLSAPLATALYSADLAPQAGEGLIVDAFANKPGGSTLDPIVLAYPASGLGDDLLDAKKTIPFTPGVNAAIQARVAYPVTATTKGFFTVFDTNLVSAATSTLQFEFVTFRASIIPEVATPHGVDAKQALGAVPLGTDALPGRIVTGNLAAAGEIDAYSFTVPEGAPFRNIQVSIISDAEVDIIVDHVPNFDDDTTTFSNVERGTNGTTADFPGSERFIRISATPVATKPTGKYTLGIRVVD
jgi:hypothetical protein